jgi:hypothetical protein
MCASLHSHFVPGMSGFKMLNAFERFAANMQYTFLIITSQEPRSDASMTESDWLKARLQ